MPGLEAIDLCFAVSQLSRNHLARVICTAGARSGQPNDGYRPSQTFSLNTGNDRVWVGCRLKAEAASGTLQSFLSGKPCGRSRQELPSSACLTGAQNDRTAQGLKDWPTPVTLAKWDG